METTKEQADEMAAERERIEGWIELWEDAEAEAEFWAEVEAMERSRGL